MCRPERICRRQVDPAGLIQYGQSMIAEDEPIEVVFYCVSCENHGGQTLDTATCPYCGSYDIIWDLTDD